MIEAEMSDENRREKGGLAAKLREMPSGKKVRWLVIIIIAAAVLAIYVTTLAPEGGQSGELEGRLAKALSGIEGAGSVEVVINEDGSGVVVVAEGADDIGVKLALLKAAKTITGADAERVEVLPMDKGEK